MKSTFTTISFSLIICLFTFQMVSGQEKKTEQKIKIIVADGSGTKVLIDTLFNEKQMPDSLRLKDGNVFYITHSGNHSAIRPEKNTEHIFVTVSDGGEDEIEEAKEITIACSDSSDSDSPGKHNQVLVGRNSKESDGITTMNYKVITRTSVNTDGHDDKFIYINDSGDSHRKMEKSYNVIVSEDNKESATEKTRYVIAKDGIVVTVEGSDEAKTKELIKEIENKLGVNNKSDVKKESANNKTKKAVKN